MPEPATERRVGALYALAAFLSWGLVPVYFKQLAQVSATEVLAHRIIWSVAILGSFVAIRGGLWSTAATLRNRRLVAGLALSGALVAFNWLVFVWAVANDRILETSLGYFINPLVNVLLGFLFLHERLRPLQWTAVLLAAVGTVYLTLDVGVLPWPALLLAFSFGFYGLIRKQLPVQPVQGLLVETLLMLPPASAYAVLLAHYDTGIFLHADLSADLLLIGTGLVTALPLLWFINAARRLPLSTVGFFQYLAPSMTFLLAVFIYDEPFSLAHGIAFGSIWTALAMFSADAAAWQRRQRAMGTG